MRCLSLFFLHYFHHVLLQKMIRNGFTGQRGVWYLPISQLSELSGYEFSILLFLTMEGIYIFDRPEISKNLYEQEF